MMICKNRHLWEKMQIIGRFFYKFKSRAGTRPAPAISRGGLATASQDAIGDYYGIPALRYHGIVILWHYDIVALRPFRFQKYGKTFATMGKKA